MDYSPALSVYSEDDMDMTEEEMDSYFANYVPLSNLPTPPPIIVKEKEIKIEERRVEERGGWENEVEAHATYLTNLIPTNISTSPPQASTIRGFLERAHLLVEILAFAACILDALSQRFAGPWRATCNRPSASPLNFQFLVQPRRQNTTAPEVVVLAALSLAHGFLSDRERSGGHWVQVEGSGLCSVRELEATKRCILQDVDYGLCRITEKRVMRMVGDMQRASDRTKTTAVRPKMIVRPKLELDLNKRRALWVEGALTPEPSP